MATEDAFVIERLPTETDILGSKIDSVIELNGRDWILRTFFQESNFKARKVRAVAKKISFEESMKTAHVLIRHCMLAGINPIRGFRIIAKDICWYIAGDNFIKIHENTQRPMIEMTLSLFHMT